MSGQAGARRTGGLRVDVLGPLRVTVDGDAVDVPGPRRRAVLALLATAEGRTVSTDDILDAVWPEEMPDTGLWTDWALSVTAFGVVPYVVYLLFLGPTLVGRKRHSRRVEMLREAYLRKKNTASR